MYLPIEPSHDYTPSPAGNAASVNQRPSRVPAPGVALVATVGSGSLDRYAQKLADRLEVERIETDIYRRTAELFNVPLLARRSLAGFGGDLRFLRTLRRAQAELLHLPNHHLGRYGYFLARPFVITVHDLIRYFDLKGHRLLIHRPNARDRLCLNLDYAGIRRATAVIAVSQATKRDLVADLGVPDERVSVIYEGVDHELFRPVAARPLADRYLLFVGSEQLRKGFTTLLRAFALLKREPRFRPLKLVKIGKAGGPEAPFRAATLAAVRDLGLEGEVVFREQVADEDLPAFYSAAECFVLPSDLEGFGLPPLEAMACGCPVIVAHAGALPEIGGDAVVTVEPRNPSALVAEIASILDDEAVRNELVRRGLDRAAEFSWERTARETAALYAAVRARLAQRTRAGRPEAPAGVGASASRLAPEDRE